ncbi:MAG: amidohydrolase family protein, partial [Tannerella sp.]|nr:amidohydrolase family protein [Tannerella sp.]
MNTILIRQAELDGKPTDVLIEGNRIKRIDNRIETGADTIIDGQRKALIPGFVNAHTHAAMTLFRGFGDDMPLKPWLEEKIWPNEAKLTEEDVYWGAKLACLEMIKSGTTCFFDMYHKLPATAQAVDEMGLRAVLSGACFDHFNAETAEKSKRAIRVLHKQSLQYASRITFALGPHAIYTVSAPTLQWVDTYARENGLHLQIHAAET